jgi:catecholate siderophore receptor
MNIKLLKRSHVIVIIASTWGAIALPAQTATPTPPPASKPAQDITELDVLVVTGRAGTDFRTKAQTSYAITDISAEQLRMQAPMGVAEALKAVPGFWVEASGGEASNNIRSRGIPTDGFSVVALLEDGLPIQHDGGLGWLNADQSYRMDETVQRMEIVRGGPSSVFASNAPGGIVNFVTRRGTESPEGVFKFEVGDFDHYRADAWYGGSSGPWRYGAGGFWRASNGVRDPGFRANDGYQARFSLGRDLPGGGKLDANLKYFDDHVIFYLPVPLTFDGSGDPDGIAGFDPLFGTPVGSELARVFVKTPAGVRTINVEGGTHVKLAQFTARFEHPLPGGWKLEDGFRYRWSNTKRENFFPGTLTDAATRLGQLRAGALAAFPTATAVQWRYALNPAQSFNLLNQNGNGLVMDGTAIGIGVKLDEVINDLRLLRKFSFGGQSHDVAFGIYTAALDETFRDLRATMFTDVRNNAGLLDLVAVNAAGAAVGTFTDNGIFRHGSNFANGSGDSMTWAFYASDEWQITRQLRIDAGVRWEQIDTDGRVERVAGANLGTPSTANVLTGTGIYDPYDRRFRRTGWTVGVDWQFTPRNGIFARVTPTFRLPSVGSFITNPNATPVIQRMDLYEVGYKYVSQRFDVFVTAFRTEFDNLSQTDNVYNPATGGFTTRTVFVGTETDGLEIEGNVRPTRWFDFAASATFQKAEWRNFNITQNVGGQPVPANYSGNRLLRVPEVAFRVIPAFNLLENRLRVQFPIEYYGDRFADAANSQKLPSYRVFNIGIRYDVNRQLSFHLNGDNLDNEIGLTEGNPRASQFQSGEAGARYYLARPILGRSYRGAVTYRF